MKLYLGAADGPLHPQHTRIMGNLKDWTFVDKYIDNGRNVLWDAETLNEVSDGSVQEIYASHLLEHFSHRKVAAILNVWHRKLKLGGKLTLNVPDLEWACHTFLKVLKNEREKKENKGYYYHSIDHTDHEHDFLQIFYGSHENEGEYHKGGFTKESLTHLLSSYQEVMINQEFEAHDMGCLLVTALK